MSRLMEWVYLVHRRLWHGHWCKDWWEAPCLAAAVVVSLCPSSRTTIPTRLPLCCTALTPQEVQAQEIIWVHGAVIWSPSWGHISASMVLQTLLTGKFYFSFISLHCKSKIRIILSVISASKHLGDLTRYKHEKHIFLFEPHLAKRLWDWFFKVHTTSVGSEGQESLPKIEVPYETLFLYWFLYIKKFPLTGMMLFSLKFS